MAVPVLMASVEQPVEHTGVTHRAALNVVVRASAEVVGKVATLAWTVLAARVLSQEDFGAVSYALTIMLVASSIPNGGFDSGLVRRGSSDPERLSRHYTANVVWKTALAVPAFALAAVLTRSTHDTLTAVVIMSAFLMSGFPELWSSSARSASAVRQRPARTSAALVLQRIVTALAITAALLLDQGAPGVAVGFLLGTVVGWVAHVRALSRLEVGLELRSVERRELSNLFGETWVIGVCSVVLMLLFRIDAVILEAIAGYEAVARYSAAYRLLETVLFVTFAINQAIFPVMSASAGPSRIRRGFERGLAVAAFVYLPFAAICIAEGAEIIRLAFGQDYLQDSPDILAWLVPAPLFYAIAFFGASVLMSRKRPAGMLLAALLATAVNLGLNLWLIPQYVGVGAAIATTVSYAVQALVMCLALRRAGVIVGVLRPLREAAIASLVLWFLLGLMRLPLFVELAIGGVAYIGVWLLLARRWAPEQVDVVRGLLGRLVR